MASAVAPPVTSKTTTSVDPLYQAAVDQAKAALEAETTPIQNEQTASDAAFQQQETDTTGAAAALQKLLAPIGPAINGEYQTAAQNQELAATGFSHGMQDALQGNTDNLNAMLKRLGSPTILDSHASQAGDVLYGLGGYNPGTAFSREGAAFGAAADLQSGDALLKGQQEVSSLKAKAIVADQGFQAKIAEMAGKLPGDIQTNYQHLQTLALEDAKFREQVSNDNFNQAAKTAAAKLAAAKYNTSVDEFNARQSLAAAKYNTSVDEFNVRQSLAERRFAQQTFQQDRTYAVSLAHLGIAQTNLQLKVAANAFRQANGGYTQAQIGKFNTTLDSLASGTPVHAVNGVMPQPTPLDKNGKPIKTLPNGALASKPAQWINTHTYTNYIKGALKKGVPIQLAVDRANTIWPENERTDLGSLAQLPAVAAQAALQQQDYGKMIGTVLGTSPNGDSVTWQVPKSLPAAAKATVNQILGSASEYLGTPYAWGGSSPTGFDCSGLAQYLYAKSGIQIPRTTYDQFKGGLAVPKSQLQAGDLVFFTGSDPKNGLPGHVGIYVGNGLMIDAPHTGDVVRVQSINSFGGYQGARRYIH